MAAHSLYDVLRTLIDRVGFPTEQERQLNKDSVNEAERMGVNFRPETLIPDIQH